jgi:phage terminase Nu1 subunit (DNA packaging protein)
MTKLDRRELAKIYKTSIDTIRKWDRMGLPRLKVGNVVRYDLQRVEAFLKKFEREAGK